MKQTFDEGPVGDIISKTGRGEPALSNAQVAAKVFHAKPTAGEDARAYLKAAGPEGVDALSDAAAYSLHGAAAKGEGFDAGKATRGINDHRLALAELPAEVRAKFETATTAQQAVSDAMAKARDDLSGFDKSEAGKVAKLQNDGDIVKHVGLILESKNAPEQRLGELAIEASGNTAAQVGLRRAAIEHVLDKFVPEGSAPKAEALKAYVAAKEPVLSKVLSPEEIKAISDKAEAVTSAAGNVEAVKGAREQALKGAQQAGVQSAEAAAKARKAALSPYETGVLKQLRGLNSEGDVLNTVKSVLMAQDGATQMQALAKEAAKVKGGSDALKKALTEAIQRDFSSTSEAGTSEVMQLKRAGLQDFMTKKTDALKAAGLSDQQIGVLRAVTEDALKSNRVISAVQSKGGSDTEANKAMGAKLLHSQEMSMMAHVALDSVLAGGGHLLGGLPGAFVGKWLGDKVAHGISEAGLNRVKQLRVEAILDPDLALALMKEAPTKPNRDAAALVGLKLRQLSMAGILASKKPGEAQ